LKRTGRLWGVGKQVPRIDNRAGWPHGGKERRSVTVEACAIIGVTWSAQGKSFGLCYLFKKDALWLAKNEGNKRGPAKGRSQQRQQKKKGRKKPIAEDRMKLDEVAAGLSLTARADGVDTQEE